MPKQRMNLTKNTTALLAGYPYRFMSVLDEIATFQNRRDEVPNQELAKRLAEMNDKNGIREIAENLWNDNKNVQGDCLLVTLLRILKTIPMHRNEA